MKHRALSNITASICSFLGIFALWIAVTSAPASAVPLLWTLNDVTFNAGGTASGSFRFDADTASYSDIAVTTSGTGDSDTSFDLVAGTGLGYLQLLDSSAGPDYSGAVTLSLSFLAELTNAGGEVGLELNSFSAGLAGCANPDCFILTAVAGDQFASGSVISEVITQVPEPATLATLGLGLGLLAFTRRKKAGRLYRRSGLDRTAKGDLSSL